MKRLSKRAACVALLLWLALATTPHRHADTAPAPPPTLPETPPGSAYAARGGGTVTVNGAGCCDGLAFPASFEVDYEADAPTGRVRVTRLYAALADVDVAFHFLIFETARVGVRCGTARNAAPVEGRADAAGNLSIADGAATLSATAFTRRDSYGDCGGGVSSLTLTNNAPLTGLLDPSSNRLTLSGSFTAAIEGHTYSVLLDVKGEYLNRPPQAVFGAEGPGLTAYAQGGCPAVPRWGNPPEPVVEANDPAGLKMYLRSFSRDPDGAWGGADLRFEQWLYGRDAEPLKFIGEGRRLGPVLFEFGPVHHLKLETTDRAGAADSAPCDFRVVDTTPPAVTPPEPTSVGASVAGGATPSTSDALRKFLGRATAADAADLGPSPLPPLLDGKEVGPDTFFPAGGWLKVTFRFADKFGNVGSAESSVSVVAPKK